MLCLHDRSIEQVIIFKRNPSSSTHWFKVQRLVRTTVIKYYLQWKHTEVFHKNLIQIYKEVAEFLWKHFKWQMLFTLMPLEPRSALHAQISAFADGMESQFKRAENSLHSL